MKLAVWASILGIGVAVACVVGVVVHHARSVEAKSSAATDAVPELIGRYPKSEPLISALAFQATRARNDYTRECAAAALVNESSLKDVAATVLKGADYETQFNSPEFRATCHNWSPPDIHPNVILRIEGASVALQLKIAEMTTQPSSWCRFYRDNTSPVSFLAIWY